MNYKGVSCPVCKQEFKEGDDIVVCPVCGAPHHRACYHQLGHCALEQELHEQGRSWENPNDQPVHHHTELQPDEMSVQLPARDFRVLLLEGGENNE